MTNNFKVGDKVRVNSESFEYEGLVGYITNIIPKGDENNINDEDDIYVELRQDETPTGVILRATIRNKKNYDRNEKSFIDSTFNGETIFGPTMLERMNKHKTLVISAFPGMGKTYLYNNMKDLVIKDSDSSKFPKDNFPKNYIEHIKEVINDDVTDVLFVSSHEEVRQALKAENIEFCLVVPPANNFDKMIKRYSDRGSSNEFINLMINNYYKFLLSCWEFDAEYNRCFMFKIDKMTPEWLNAIYEIFTNKKKE